MKKLFTLFTFVFFSLTVLAENVVVDDIKYSIDYGKREATVIANTSGNGYSGEVVIPASITALGMEFSVTGIGKNAFYFCPDLTSITIPNTITSIDKYAFYESSRLTSVNITDLSAWCKIEFGVYTSNPLYYAKKLFLNGEEVKDLVIPDDVTSIGKYAFISCSGLTSVTIPNSVTSIGDWAFFNCSGLTSVTIPNSVTSIGEFAFDNCYGLTSVTIPNSVTTIGEYAFYGCDGLTSVNITDLSAWCKIEFGIYSSNPFYYARKLFLNGEEVKDLVIPDDVTSIGEYAFSLCSGLTSVTIPNSVTSIGTSAFYGCSGLTYVTLGNSVESIGSRAFVDCKNLENVYCLAENVPTTGSTAFFDVDYCTLYVPEGSIENYKATEPWSRFGHILSLEDAPDIPTTISSVNGVNTTKSQIYRLDGTRANILQRGINIVKTAKGVKKVMK